MGESPALRLASPRVRFARASVSRRPASTCPRIVSASHVHPHPSRAAPLRLHACIAIVIASPFIAFPSRYLPSETWRPPLPRGFQRAGRPGAHPCNLGAKLKDRARPPPQPPSSSSSVQTEQRGVPRLLLPPPPNPPLREVHSSVLASTTTLGKKKWKDRAQKNYPDVSFKDAPVPPALPSPQCECGKPAWVTQSMHPDTAARAYYKITSLFSDGSLRLLTHHL
ncbi:hypothetical protein HU200_041232 [Digitaria exilis]|uniref:Uncharacterized protein n=1 Tax=Digitaria exilis TaxID=1010633 RepID=A0A835B9Y1_9POAL|nr:hypothetical protein HU200_041232 [Digitaria exilis]